MSEKDPLGIEFALVRRAVSSLFSARVLAWQLGGTVVAGVCFVAFSSIGEGGGGAVRFILTALGFMLGYVVLSATGCIVARVVDTSAEAKPEAGVAPLHFLVDNIGTATLIPLVASGAAVVLTIIFCLLAMLWRWDAGQAILVFLVPVAFAVALSLVVKLIVLLFLVPSMVAMEQPAVAAGLRRLSRLLWQQKLPLARLFGVGLAVAVIIVVPVLLIMLAVLGGAGWLYALAAGALPTTFASFMLRMWFALLIVAPVLTLPLAFLNALAVAAYDQVAAAADAEAEDEETLLTLEDVDLPVQEDTDSKEPTS